MHTTHTHTHTPHTHARTHTHSHTTHRLDLCPGDRASRGLSGQCQCRHNASRASVVPPSVAPLPLLCQDAREVLRGDIELAKPSLELIVVDGAVAVRVELGEELLHELIVVLGVVLDRCDGLQSNGQVCRGGRVSGRAGRSRQHGTCHTCTCTCTCRHGGTLRAGLRGGLAEVVRALEFLLGRVDEGLGGETRRTAEVSRASARDHAAVHALAQPRREDLSGVRGEWSVVSGE